MIKINQNPTPKPGGVFCVCNQRTGENWENWEISQLPEFPTCLYVSWLGFLCGCFAYGFAMVARFGGNALANGAMG